MMGEANDKNTVLASHGAIENTPIGQQYLMGDMQPVTTKEKLDWLARLPMQPKRALHQKPCNHGLFDDVARNQMELFS